MPRVSISVVTWNSAKTICDCMESILSQDFEDFEVIVVDNASVDETCAQVAKCSDPRVELLRLDTNTGFTGGHNLAIGKASGEFVLLVNPDATLHENYLRSAVQRMESDRAIGIVCGLLLEESGAEARIDTAGLQFVTRNRRFVCTHSGKKRSDVNLVAGEVAGADGALPLFRREMIEDLTIDGEFFDDLFFAHKEDWDVSWRAQMFGWKIVCDPECLAVHSRSFKPEDRRVRASLSEEVRYHAVKNQLILILKNEDWENFSRDWIHIFTRLVLIFFYSLLFERGSLGGFFFVLKHRREILAKRRRTRSKRRVEPLELRRRLRIL